MDGEIVCVCAFAANTAVTAAGCPGPALPRAERPAGQRLRHAQQALLWRKIVFLKDYSRVSRFFFLAPKSIFIL